MAIVADSFELLQRLIVGGKKAFLCLLVQHVRLVDVLPGGEQSEVILDNGGCSPVDSAVGAMQRCQGSVGRLRHFPQACASRDDGAAVPHRDGQYGLHNTAVVAC